MLEVDEKITMAKEFGIKPRRDFIDNHRFPSSSPRQGNCTWSIIIIFVCVLPRRNKNGSHHRREGSFKNKDDLRFFLEMDVQEPQCVSILPV